MEFSRQESWSGLPFPSPGDPPNPEIKGVSLASSVLAGPLPLVPPINSESNFNINSMAVPGNWNKIPLLCMLPSLSSFNYFERMADISTNNRSGGFSITALNECPSCTQPLQILSADFETPFRVPGGKTQSQALRADKAGSTLSFVTSRSISGASYSLSGSLGFPTNKIKFGSADPVV